MQHRSSSSRPPVHSSRVSIATLGFAVLVAFAGGSAAAAVCDPPGPPPRFGCQWSETDCTWLCAICDPFGAPPRTSCGWDLNSCNWICPGYTGVDVMVRTLQAPASTATVYVRLSSLCTSTGAAATCEGSFAVHAGMPLSEKCASIAQAIASNCAAAGYAVSTNDCASSASLTASNTGCPGTQFAVGLSNDPSVFDQSANGPLPDGEAEAICAPPPGSATDLRLAKLGSGSGLHLSWTDAANSGTYSVFADPAAGGTFDAAAGTATSGAVGVDMAMPAPTEFFLVAAGNATCGAGPKR
jgi:hypothetical protein